MSGESFATDIAHAVTFFFLLQYVKNSSAAGFRVAVEVAPHGRCPLDRPVGHFFRQTEIERVRRAGLNAERLLVLAQAIAAHGALGRLVRDVALRDYAPRASVDAILTTDADLWIDDDRAFLVFGDGFHRADGGAGRKVAVHTTIPRPKRRKPFEHRRLYRDPV